VSETKAREPQFALPDELPEDHLPEPVALTHEQIAAQAEAEEQDRLRRLDWAMINQALADNSMAVTRAMSRWYSREGDRERQIERVMTRYEDGSFLINRLGAEGVIDQDLVVVLLDLRRRLIDEYGDAPASVMLIDRAVAAYQDFIRIAGWTGNTALMIEAEFFGRDRPCFEFRDRHGREGREIRGLTVEQHLAHLREALIPLAERCARVMREALASLETLRTAPSPAVERSRPAPISVIFEPRTPG
jgi:hypothetical protein